MGNLWQLIWERFRIIQDAVGDATARIIMLVMYFTLVMVFAVPYTLTSDPLRMKESKDGAAPGQEWVPRDAVPTDIQSAREQG